MRSSDYQLTSGWAVIGSSNNKRSHMVDLLLTCPHSLCMFWALHIWLYGMPCSSSFHTCSRESSFFSWYYWKLAGRLDKALASMALNKDILHLVILQIGPTNWISVRANTSGSLKTRETCIVDNYVTFSFSKERAIINLKLKQTWSQCSDPFYPVVS